MDIREIDGLWCDDITFCQEKCDMRDCPRNQCNIRDHNIPHSFSVERPKDCPKEKVMPDREKTIKAMEYHKSGKCKIDGILCPYWEYENCDGQLESDALELLKNHEAVKPRVSCVEQRCGNCNKIIEMDGWIACPWCGKPIKWEGR